jgi:hypothetical protein
VLAAVTEEPVRAHVRELRTLANEHRVVLGGVGASPAIAEEIGVGSLTVDPITAADELSGLARSDR